MMPRLLKNCLTSFELNQHTNTCCIEVAGYLSYFKMKISTNNKRRLQNVFKVMKVTFHWGFIPFVIYLGMYLLSSFIHEVSRALYRLVQLAYVFGDNPIAMHTEFLSFILTRNFSQCM